MASELERYFPDFTPAAPADCPPDGLYPDTPEHVYRAWDAVNQTSLRTVHTHTLAHYYEELLHPKAPTPAMVFGSAMHHALLQPALFADEYVGGLDIDRRSNKNKAKWAEFEAEHAGKVILKADHFQTILDIIDAVWDNPTASALLGTPGLTEVAAVATHEKTGLRRKGLIDHLTTYNDYPTIVDLKSTEDASQEAFSKSIARYGYAWQGAFYGDLLHTLSPVPRRVVILAVEKSRPYCVQAHELDERDMDDAREDYEATMERVAEARETGRYPGYPQGVHTTRVPVWARRNLER